MENNTLSHRRALTVSCLTIRTMLFVCGCYKSQVLGHMVWTESTGWSGGRSVPSCCSSSWGVSHLIRTLPFGGILGEIRGWNQKRPEGLSCIRPGNVSWNPPGGAGKCCRERDDRHFTTESYSSWWNAPLFYAPTLCFSSEARELRVLSARVCEDVLTATCWTC